MRTTSISTARIVFPLALLVVLALPGASHAQAMTDRPTPGASTRPVAEAPAVDAITPLRQRIADAIAAIKANWRPQASVQQAPTRSPRFASTRRAVR